MDSYELRFRQVHLDYHTSPDIEGVAAEFDAEKFSEVLVSAKVNSVTCFARCHHGLMYYDSKINPERVHPHLANKNLLAEQIEACHKKGICVPIYTTVQWDYYTTQEHPEWMMVSADGSIIGQKPYEAGFYGFLCVNTPYKDFLMRHTLELLESFPVDGLFYDILQVRECSCSWCRAGMERKGIDPADSKARLKYAQHVIDNFKLEMTSFIRKYNKKCSIFYNKGHIGTAHRPIREAYSHFELETLPGGEWGYMHFPLTVRYARNLGLDCLAHTGKFHTSWGDFHSFKNREALEFECFNILSQNAKCLIGDQLEPTGVLSHPVYELIGEVYSQINKKEPWCIGAKSVVDIGVLTPEEFYGADVGELPPALMGAAKILQRSSHQFDIIDSQSDFSTYKLLILPDDIPVSDVLADKLERYIIAGGKVVASFESGMSSDKSEFKFKSLGVNLRNEVTCTPDGTLVRGKVFKGNAYADYILPIGKIGKGLYETEHVMYLKGVEVDAIPGSEILSKVILPHFNRTYKHFCSHRQTPSSGKSGYDGIVKSNSTIYFAHPIFRLYNEYAPRWCKLLVLNAIDMFLPEPIIRHNGPATMLTTVNEQRKDNRYVLHLLHYVPERVSQTMDIIEDVIPLYNVKMSVRVPRKVQSITMVPALRELEFECNEERMEFIVPEINGHEMIAIKFAN